MPDLDPKRRAELADQLRAGAPWGSVEDGDIYVRLVDGLVELGWALPPKTMPLRPEGELG